MVKKQQYKPLQPFFLLFFISTLFFSSNHLQALDANITYATFKGIDQENYIEVYLHVLGRTVEFKREKENKFQAAVEVLITFEQEDGIKAYDKFVVKSPMLTSLRIANLGLVDLRRLHLSNGSYTLKVDLKDLNDLKNVNSYETKVVIDYGEDKVHMSDIQLLNKYSKSIEEDKYTKHGYQLNPFTYTVYPSAVSRITFFAEIYNTKIIGTPHLVRYYLYKEGDEKTPITGCLGFKKQQPNDVNVVLAQLDISLIPTGDYLLVLEVRDADNELIQSKSTKIKRSNLLDYNLDSFETADITDSFVESLEGKELKDKLECLAPRIDNNYIPLLNTVVKSKNEELQRKFLLHFWTQYNEVDPTTPYEQYGYLVEEANEYFDVAFSKGYKTDRGLIYLRYGPPYDIISADSEPNAPPYQIWYYNTLVDEQRSDVQRNVKFIFFNPSLANDDYVLLHSTAKGEFNNPDWKDELYNTAIDNTSTGRSSKPTFGSNADRYDDY